MAQFKLEDLFENLAIEQRISNVGGSIRPTNQSTSVNRNASFQNNITNIFKGVNPNDNSSIEKTLSKINTFEQNYNKGSNAGNFNEDTIFLIDEMRDRLKNMSQDNSEFEAGLKYFMNLDETISGWMQGERFDPMTGEIDDAYNIMNITDEAEFQEAVSTNAGLYLDDLHKYEQEFANFNFKYNKRLQGQQFAKTNIMKGFAKLTEWKNLIGQEIRSQFGLTKEEFNVLIQDPKAFEAYKKEINAQNASKRKVIEADLKKTSKEYQEVANAIKTKLIPTDLGTIDGKGKMIPLEGEELNLYKANLTRLQLEGDRLNKLWRGTFYLPQQNKTFIDFNIDKDTGAMDFNSRLEILRNDSAEREQFINDPKAYAELNQLDETQVSKIDSLIKKGFKQDTEGSDNLVASGFSGEGGSNVDDIKSVQGQGRITDENKEQIKQVLAKEGMSDDKKKEAVINIINKTVSPLKEKNNQVYVNQKNSSDISYTPKKGYTKIFLDKSEILKRQRQQQNKQEMATNISSGDAYRQLNSSGLLDNADVRKGRTKQQVVKAEIKDYNSKARDISFVEYVKSKYGISQNLTQNR